MFFFTGMGAILTATHPAQAAFRSSIKPAMSIEGFHAEAVYTNYEGRELGSKWVRDQTRMPLYFFGMETVPQAAFWVDIVPESRRGEAHALEHVLLGKGTTGRSNDLLTDMRLGGDLAATFSHFVYYQLYSSGNVDSFYEQLQSLFTALFKSDATDEEIRREVYHWGLNGNELAEKGTVYNEIIGHEGKDNAYWEMMRQLFGPNNPITWPLGGEPEFLRTQTVAHVRAFQKDHYVLGPATPLVVVLPPEQLRGAQFNLTLRQLNHLLNGFEDGRKTAVQTPPAPQPIQDKGVHFVEFPSKSKDDHADIFISWRPLPSNTIAETYELRTFIPAFGEHILKPALVDNKTREITTGATGLYVSLNRNYYFPFFETYVSGIPSSEVSREKIELIATMMQKKIKMVASWKDHSSELQDFNKKVLFAMKKVERDERQTFGSPPYFAIRGSGSTWKEEWKDRLEELDHETGFVRSLTLNAERESLRKKIESGHNLWADLLRKYQLLDTPYATVGRASPSLLEKIEKERKRRHTEKRDEIGDIEEFRKEEAEAEKETAQIGSRVKKVKFTRFPPLTFDDSIRYRTLQLADGLPLTETRFDTSSKIDFGISFDLKEIPQSLYLYLPLLHDLFFNIGLKEGNKVTSYRDLKSALDADVLSLYVSVGGDAKRNSYELTFRVSGFDAEEIGKGLDYLQRAIQSAYLEPENKERFQDIIAERLSGEDSYLRGNEYDWLYPMGDAFEYQNDPLYLPISSFFSREHLLHRLQWRLRPALSIEERDKLRASLLKTIEKVKSLSPSHTIDVLRGDHTAAFPQEEEVREYLAKQVKFMAPGSYIEPLRQLIEEMWVDTGIGPAHTIDDLKRLRSFALTQSRARAFLVGSAPMNRASILQIKKRLARAFPEKRTWKPSSANPVKKVLPVVLASVRKREPSLEDRYPLYVALVNPDATSTSLRISAKAPDYSRVDRDSLGELLGFKLFAGRGPHSAFSQMWSAGLCYSNGFSANPYEGKLEYNAFRCPHPADALQFASSLADKIEAMNDPALIDYVLANSFGFSREARAYDLRGWSIAHDLTYGPKPESVRKHSLSIQKIRNYSKLSDLIQKGSSVAFKKVVHLNGDEDLKSDSHFFFAGPEPQLQEIEKKLSGHRLIRIYPADFWTH